MDVRNNLRPALRRDWEVSERTVFSFGHIALLNAELLSFVRQKQPTHQQLSRQRLKHLGLKQRDIEILQAIGDCKIMNTNQIQRIFFTKLTTDKRNIRAARRALHRLVSKKYGYINRLRSIGGADAGSTASDYTLTASGAKLLSTAERVYEPYKPDLRGTFYEHVTGLTGFYTTIRELAKNGPLRLIALETEPTCHRSYGSPNQTLRPDQYLRAAYQIGTDTLFFHWFIEWDNDQEHRAEITRKLWQYQEYALTGIEQQKYGTFPLVLWIVPDAHRKNWLLKLIRGTEGLIAELFIVKTRASVNGYFANPT
jgi:hypothetical protein